VWVEWRNFFVLVVFIRAHGLLQPIKVRPNNDGFELIYGHRRTAAMRHLGWIECEAIIEDLDDDQALLQAVNENLHRKDMTVFEEADIYKALRERGYAIDRIAKLVSKPQGHVSNRLSLLRLPTEVQEMIRPGNNQQVATTEYGAISVDSASRISAAAQTPTEAVQVARKAVSERLTASEVRTLTAQLKHARTEAERRNIVTKPFHPCEMETTYPGLMDASGFHANRSSYC
jgi:ParB/RepB/Spo0J family partition protein